MQRGTVWTLSIIFAFYLGWISNSIYNLGEGVSDLADTEPHQTNKQVSSSTAENSPLGPPAVPEHPIGHDLAMMGEGFGQETAREMLLHEGIVLPPDMPLTANDNQADNSTSESLAKIDLIAEMKAHDQWVAEMKAAGNWPPKPLDNQSMVLPPDDWVETNRLGEELTGIQ